jgi:hypothetical protein
MFFLPVMHIKLKDRESHLKTGRPRLFRPGRPHVATRSPHTTRHFASLTHGLLYKRNMGQKGNPQ